MAPFKSCVALLSLLLAAAAVLCARAQDGGPWPAGPPVLPGLDNLFGAPMPDNPIPNGGYRGTYGHVTCTAEVLVRPSDTQELASAVRTLAARANKEGRPLKMRATRDGFASMASFTCAAQPTDPGYKVDGKQPLTAGLLLDKMTRVLSVDLSKRQVKIQGQATLKDLYAAANSNGMSIPRSSLPWWQGLTLAGVFVTSSHGSGHNVPSVLCDWTESVTWVDGTGEIRTSYKGSEEMRGLCGGIGLMGVVAELTLQLTEPTNTRLSTWLMRDDGDLANDVEKMLQITPHLVVLWRPDLKKYTGHLQTPAPADAPALKDATCAVIPSITPLLAQVQGASLRAWQKDPTNRDALYGVTRDQMVCNTVLQFGLSSSWVTRPTVATDALGLTNPVYEGVAPTNNVQSTDCGDRCVFIAKDAQMTALDVEFAFEKTRLAEWIADMKALVQKDLQALPGMTESQRCLTPGFYVMRFGRAPDTHIGMAAGLKEPVYVQQQLLVSRNTPGVLSRYEWVQETYEQLMLCKYGGRPHWGKNWDRTFTNPKCPVTAKNPSGFAAMKALQDRYDPARVFEPELWGRMVRGEKFRTGPKCELTRGCFCESDGHCPDQYRCVASAAFPEFKACRPEVWNRK